MFAQERRMVMNNNTTDLDRQSVIKDALSDMRRVEQSTRDAMRDLQLSYKRLAAFVEREQSDQNRKA